MNPKFFRNGIVMLALVVVALAVVVTLVSQSSPSSEVAYTTFLQNVQAGDVKGIVQEGSKLTVTPTGGATYTVIVPVSAPLPETPLKSASSEPSPASTLFQSASPDQRPYSEPT